MFIKLNLSSFIFSVLFLFSFYSCSDNKINKNNIVTTDLKPAEEHFREKYGDLSESYLQHKHLLISDEVTRYKLQRSGSPQFSGPWVTQGPGNIGCRINTIAIHPKDENIILVGLSQGGIFRTTDGGNSWQPIFDAQDNLSMGDISFDPINPKIIYAGSGDLNGGYYVGVGNGLYKSIDGGNTWTNIGLQQTRIISKVIVDPKASNILYVSALGNLFERNANRGIYKSTDSGSSWFKVFYIADSVGVSDLVIDPKNSNNLFAVTWDRTGTNAASTIQGPNTHLYSSKDAGQTWNKVSGGLPNTLANGRIAIAMYPEDPKIIYVQYNRSSSPTSGQQLAELYRTNDGGDTWTSIPFLNTNSGLPADALGGFGWYFGRLIINPSDPDDIMILGVDLFRSYDGGFNWLEESPNWSTYEVHADKHDVEFFPNGDYLLATDGGLYQKLESINKWFDIENIAGNQLYRVAYNHNDPDLYYGGAQDNGSFGGNQKDINNWERIYGGDGFQMAFHKTNPLIVYAESQNGNLVQSTDGGLSFNGFTQGFRGTKNWDMPYMLSHHNQSKLIAGSTRIYVNRDDQIEDFKSISPVLTLGSRYPARSTPSMTTLDESRLDSNIIIAGTTNGNVWITYNAGQSWDSISIGLPASYISCVKTSVIDPNTVFVTLSGQRNNDYSAKVFKSTNKGKTWTRIASNLPAAPVFDIFVLPEFKDRILFVGTDIGVYASIDGGLNWERLGDNMPYIPVYDIEWNETKNELIAGTYARSIQTFDLSKITKNNVANKELQESNSIKIYPNPAKEFITIESDAFKSVLQYEIYDVCGTSLMNGNINSKKNRIDIQSLHNGHCFIRFSNGVTKKFIKINDR